LAEGKVFFEEPQNLHFSSGSEINKNSELDNATLTLTYCFPNILGLCWLGLSSMMSNLRTVFVTRSLPYPPIGGAPLRNWQNINIMMKFGSVAVFCLPTLPHELNQKTQSPPIEILWSIHYPQDRQLVLQEKIERRWRQFWWLLTRGHPFTNTKKYYTRSIERELTEVLTQFQPHIVIFEEPWLYCYLPTVKSFQCRIVLDAHNAETSLLLETSGAETRKDLMTDVRARLELAKVRSIERDFIREVDCVWVCSDRDAKLLQKLTRKAVDFHIIPNGVDLARYDCRRLDEDSIPDWLRPEPQTVIFAASFNYGPNELAAKLSIEEIYPLLKATYPNCRLLLVGVDPTESMRQAAKQNPNIIVTGKVPSVLPYLAAASVVAVPLLQGGGTRLKILEAFAAGRPVVSTSKGAEGLRVRNGEHLLIGENAGELAAGICKIWSDSCLTQRLVRSAYEFVRTEHSWEAVAQTVERAVDKLLS
jgi:glycosyltransferase involved in cell wall biosynthesis